MGRYSSKEAAQLAKRASKEQTPHEVKGITVKRGGPKAAELSERRPSSGVVGRLVSVFRRKRASAGG